MLVSEEQFQYRKEMSDFLEKFNKQVERFNASLSNQVLTGKEVNEEKENYDDYKKAVKKFSDLIEKLESQSTNDFKQNSKLLIEMHLEMCNITWYWNNLHENLQKIIKEYPYVE